MSIRLSRRAFGERAAALAGSLVLGAACDLDAVQRPPADGRLTARPGRRPAGSADLAGSAKKTIGTRALGLEPGRDAVLHVPASAGASPLPLFVLLHGAGSSGDRMLKRIVASTDAAGFAVLAPDSRGPTWDAIRDGFGADVTFLNRALERVFSTIVVDPARVVVGGFSDGATYALSLGLVNGELFRRIVAFSPGFVVEGPPQARPACFVSHGTRDTILPIDRCSRRIVPALRARGYDVTFREFEGGHEIPEPIAREGMSWADQPGLS